MYRFPKKKRKRDEVTTISLRDEILLGSIVVCVLLSSLLCVFVCVTFQARQTLQKQLADWRIKYHLDDRQIQRIEQLERDFHGNGNLFTRPIRSLEETRQHDLALSREMSPEDAERFLESIKKKTADP